MLSLTQAPPLRLRPRPGPAQAPFSPPHSPGSFPAGLEHEPSGTRGRSRLARDQLLPAASLVRRHTACSRSGGSGGNTGGHGGSGTRGGSGRTRPARCPSPSFPSPSCSPALTCGNGGGAGWLGSVRFPRSRTCPLGVAGGAAQGRNAALLPRYPSVYSSRATQVIRRIKFLFRTHNTVWALAARFFPGPKSCSRVPLRLPQNIFKILTEHMKTSRSIFNAPLLKRHVSCLLYAG